MLRGRQIGSPSHQECRPKPLRMAGRFLFYTPESRSGWVVRAPLYLVDEVGHGLESGDTWVHPR